MDIFINNEKLTEAQTVKYLGVLIDNKLAWKAHIQQTKSIGILAGIRHNAPRNILVNIYNAFIQSHVTYGIINWGGTYKTALDPVRKSTKHAVRLITFQP